MLCCKEVLVLKLGAAFVEGCVLVFFAGLVV